MKNENEFEIEGTVSEIARNTFHVEYKDSSGATKKVSCTLSGKIRMNTIQVTTGDRVRVKIPLVDQKRGIIIYRFSK